MTIQTTKNSSIQSLKNQAKILADKEKITLSQALKYYC